MTMFQNDEEPYIYEAHLPLEQWDALRPRFDQCRTDLTRLAMPRRVRDSDLATKDTSRKASQSESAQWNTALRFIKQHSVWLFTFRDLIEAAQQNLKRVKAAENNPIPTRSQGKAKCCWHDSARQVMDAAKAITAIASIRPEQAVSREHKSALWQNLSLLLVLEREYLKGQGTNQD